MADIPMKSRKFRRYRLKVRSSSSPIESGRKSRVLIKPSETVRPEWVADAALYQSFSAKRNFSAPRCANASPFSSTDRRRAVAWQFSTYPTLPFGGSEAICESFLDTPKTEEQYFACIKPI